MTIMIPPNSPSCHSVYEEAIDHEATGIGLSASNLNYGMRRMFDVMKKLHNTGVQVDIDLPQIAVIGNQSAGKSSLIEAVSGITLPRASGTCTRCPTECHLTRTEKKWQCIVSLRITTDAHGKPLGQAKNEQFGDIIYDKAHVEDRIRRAQRAILNPQVDFLSFLREHNPNPKTTLPQLPFSLNCITLSISGPDVADLSFCDLPGLIASVGHGGDVTSIALVNKMVESYIQKPSCIILLTVACETDFENQGAHRLAKQHDPEGRRTIGVLTKPDRIPQGEESSWIPFIRDEKEPLENNWFCVKLPSSFELNQGLSWELTKQLEEDFFSKASSPWAEVEEPYRKYLGTTNLVERLSTVLADLIATRVPQIQDELERYIANTREQISRLPSPPAADPRSEILNLLYKFVQDVTQHVKGVPEGISSETSPGLIQSMRPEQQKFKKSIRTTAPIFWPFERNVTNGWVSPTYFLRDEEGAEYENMHIFGGNGVPVKICIDEVYERIQKALTRELPGHVPHIVGENYIRSIVKQWEAPSEILTKAVSNIVSKHMKQMVHDHFYQFGQGRLEQQVRSIVQAHLNACLIKAEARVKYHRKLEQSWPFTMNDHQLRYYTRQFLAHYRSAREVHAAKKASPPSCSVPQSKFDFTAKSKPEPSATKPAADGTPKPGFTPASSVFSGGSSASAAASFGTGSPFKPAVETNVLNFPPASTLFSASAAGQDSSAAPAGITPAQREAAMFKIMSGLAEIGKTGITEADLAKLSPPDPMEPALAIMANVRAYFQVAYKRFIDNVPLAIDVELVTGFVEDLLPTLFTQLGINGPKGDAICKEFAEENRKIASRRLELTKKLERLEAGHNELFSVFV